MFFNIDTTAGPTLLFIDEIQEQPKAIALLRYFYEDLPEIDVIAAGSLLEFAMHEVSSFPVGRVEQLAMHPLDFDEFLMALGEKKAKEILHTIPIADYAHEKLLDLFHQYIRIGGMPEVVLNYVQNNKNIHSLQKTYSSIWDNYKVGRNVKKKRKQKKNLKFEF